MCTFPLTLQGQPYEGCPSNSHPHHRCPNKNMPCKYAHTHKHTHLMAGWQGGCSESCNFCLCVCALLGVCSSNKGKRSVLLCFIRRLCSALSACLISVCVSVSPAVDVDDSQPLDHLEKSTFRKDLISASVISAFQTVCLRLSP